MSIFKRKKKDSLPESTQDRALELLAKAVDAANETADLLRPTLLKNQFVWESNYGLDKSNPIISESLQDTTAYLSRLCTSDGKKFTWSGYTTIRASVHGLPDVGEDRYTLYLAGQPYIDVFFVPYIGTADFPPAGLFFSDDTTDWDQNRRIAKKAFECGKDWKWEKRLMEAEAEEQKLANEKATKKTEARREISFFYPDVNIDEEIKNPLFDPLLNLGFNAVTIYEYIHSNQLLTRKKQPLPKEKISIPTLDYYRRILLSLYHEQFERLNEIKTLDVVAYAKKIGSTLEIARRLQAAEYGAMKEDWEKREQKINTQSREAIELKKIYPLFNLEEEIKNELFVRLIDKVSLQEAYEIIHFSDCFEKKTKEKHSIPSVNPNEHARKMPSVEVEEAPSNKCLFCRNCGKQIPFESNFCPHCGTSVIRESQLSKKEWEYSITSFSSVFRKYFYNIIDCLDDSAITQYVVQETACFLLAIGDIALFLTGRSERDRLRFAQEADSELMTTAHKEYPFIKINRNSRLDLYGKVMRGGYIRNEWSFGSFDISVFDNFPIGKAFVAFGDILINPECANNYEGAPILINDYYDQHAFAKMFTEEIMPDIIKFCDEVSQVS